MTSGTIEKLSEFLDVLGLEEEPMGLFFTDEKPAEGFSPKPKELPTREREKNNEVNWQAVFGDFSCVIGNIWRARRKKTAAYFSAEQYGCVGGAFFLGFNKPQTETIIHYVSSGIPGYMEGEHYAKSADELRRVFADIDPVPAPKTYCVVKPVSQFQENEEPVLVLFFARPEIISGLHQLAFFVTSDPEVVASPWAAACGGIVTWPMKYLSKGENRAVVGGWDPSARKFYAGDELSFTVPYQMFTDMVNQWDQSFLKTKTWSVVRKKIDRSKKMWGKGSAD